MSDANTRRFVVGYDYSPISDLALTRALDMAALEKSAEVHVVHVVMLGVHAGAGVSGVPVQPTVSLDSSLKTLKERVTHQVKKWGESSKKSFDTVRAHIRADAPAGEVAQIASDLGADLIVIGTHGRRGLRRLLLGSVAEGIVRMAHCAVLVVRPDEEPVDVPKIEPPCPRCVEERIRTEGKEMWCEQHRERHGQRHTYHYQDRISRDGSMPLMTGMHR